MEPPYDWKVTEEKHSWNHYTPGVCLYCAHCIILMEEMPMDRFGYPVRVIDPPVYDADTRRPSASAARSASGRCSRTRPRCPEEYYERVGRTKPTVVRLEGARRPRAAR